MTGAKSPPPPEKGRASRDRGKVSLAQRRIRIVAVRIAFPNLSIPTMDEHFGSLINRLLASNLDRFALGFYHPARFLTASGLYGPSVGVFYYMFIGVGHRAIWLLSSLHGVALEELTCHISRNSKFVKLKCVQINIFGFDDAKILQSVVNFRGPFDRKPTERQA